MFSPAHMHLLLNHIPVFGVLAAIPILLFGLLKNQVMAQKIALWFLIVSGILIVPVYLSGDSAEHIVESFAGVSEATLERHEDLGKLSLWLTLALGVLALLALLKVNKNPDHAGKILMAILILTFIVAGVQGNTAMEGGKIRRPELRGLEEIPEGAKDSWMLKPESEYHKD
jgi:uncharacterized membrane protein